MTLETTLFALEGSIADLIINGSEFRAAYYQDGNITFELYSDESLSFHDQDVSLDRSGFGELVDVTGERHELLCIVTMPRPITKEDLE